MKTLLFAFGALILLSANVYLLQSGWITEAVDSKPPITGVYPLDLLLRFFPELHANAATQLVMDVMNGFGGTVIALITFEACAQRMPNRVNALYMPIAQFVAIGFATPVFLGLLLERQQTTTLPRRPVGKAVAYTVFLTLVFTGMLGNMLQQAGDDVRVLIAFLFFPVFSIPAALLLLDGGEKQRDSIGAEEMSFQLCVVNGIVAHYKMLYVLATTTLSVSMLNPPSVFLLLDLLGVVGGAYMWIIAQKDAATVFTPKSIAQLVLLGPGAHFALLCLDRANKAKFIT